MKRVPVSASSPRSSTSTTFGCAMRLALCASLVKRCTATASREKAPCSSLTATRRPVHVFTASCTAPMPPWPSRWSSRYFPASSLPSDGGDGSRSTACGVGVACTASAIRHRHESHASA
jgi:hypothetical protein